MAKSTKGRKTDNRPKRSQASTYRLSRRTTYKQPLNINIGMIIFAVILIYVMYSIFRYATMKHVAGYEVRTGALSLNRVYEGIALREEEIAISEYAGHINYYTKEGDRLATGKLAYTIDESGEVQDMLSRAEADGDSVFTEEDYSDLQADVVSFTRDFQPGVFGTVYDFKNTLTDSVQKLTNTSILDDIQNMSQSGSVHYVNTDQTGYMMYYTDGYEDKTFEEITPADFNSDNYERTELDNNSMVSAGDPAYKMELAEDWSCVIMLDSQEEAKKLEDLHVVRVRFLKNQNEAWATVSVRQDGNGQNYAKLAFTNSMLMFSGDRFIKMELETEETEGLKIPLTALIDDDFFVVPEAYVTSASSDQVSVLRQVYSDSGTASTEVLTLTPYGQNDNGDYLVDSTVLRSGDLLLMQNSQATFSVGATAKLQGVYNINKGYADFRQVSIVSQNDEYAIVKPDSMFGLREFDYIVLDASTMDPNEFLYE